MQENTHIPPLDAPIWISIANMTPEVGVLVLFICEIDGAFHNPAIGKWTGRKTEGEAIVMDYGEPDDWSPCTHWMPISFSHNVKCPQCSHSRELADDALNTLRVIGEKYGIGNRHVMTEKNREIEKLREALQVIHTWATYQGGRELFPKHLKHLTEKTLFGI